MFNQQQEENNFNPNTSSSFNNNLFNSDTNNNNSNLTSPHHSLFTINRLNHHHHHSTTSSLSNQNNLLPSSSSSSSSPLRFGFQSTKSNLNNLNHFFNPSIITSSNNLTSNTDPFFSRSSSTSSNNQTLQNHHHHHQNHQQQHHHPSREVFTPLVRSSPNWLQVRPPSSQSFLNPPSPPIHPSRHSNHTSIRSTQPHPTSLPVLSPHLWDQRRPRQWGWTGVDIPVHGLASLRDQIERSPTSSMVSKLDGLHLPHDDPALDGLDYSAGEVLSCNFGNDRWKVEVVRGPTRRLSAPTTPTNVSHQPTTSPIIGRTLNGAIRPSTPPRFNHRTIEEQHPKLSLYLTCNEIDWQTSHSISTSILISIKEPRIPLHSNPTTDLSSHHEGWIWSTQPEIHTFEKEKEVWECTSLPSLSYLLNNPRVNSFDSFLLCIQISTPAVFSVPQIPMASFIPHSVLESLESLLDDPNTSDVQIVLTEVLEGMGTNHLTRIETSSEGSERSSHHVSRCGGARRTGTRFRKRVLYAHSSILKHRSEYFKTMLADELHGGGWAESGPRPTPSTHHSNTSDHISPAVPPTLHSSVDRKLGLIKIEDFDFVSVYWLLRWLYSNRIFFEEHEDVRVQCHIGAVLASSEISVAAGGRSTGMITRNSGSKTNSKADLDYIWGWQTLPISHHSDDGRETDGDEKPNAKNFEPGQSVNEASGEQNATTLYPENQTESHAFDMKASTSNLATQAQLDPTPIDTTNSASTGSHNQHSGSSRSPTSRFSFINQTSLALDSSNYPIVFPPNTGADQTGSVSHHSSNWLVGDPHSHPVEMKEKASAFAIYRLSHRYELKALQDLAITHLISNLDPASAFPMLLASFIFPELHAEVKAYCLAHYFEILQEPEFRRCYAEVGDGLWEHGGEVLLSFTMSLRPGPPLA